MPNDATTPATGEPKMTAPPAPQCPPATEIALAFPINKKRFAIACIIFANLFVAAMAVAIGMGVWGGEGYWHDIVRRAWHSMQEFGDAAGLPRTVMSIFLYFALNILLVHLIRGRSSAREKLLDTFVGLITSISFLAVVFLVIIIFIAPSEMYKESRIEKATLLTENLHTKADLLIVTNDNGNLTAENKTINDRLSTVALASGINPNGGLSEKIDVFIADFQQTIKDLQQNKQAVLGLQDELKKSEIPIGAQSIAAITVTCEISYVSTEAKNANYSLFTGLMCFGRGDIGLIMAKATSISSTSDGKGHIIIRATGAMADDDSFSGNPISSLASSEYIEIIFDKAILAENTPILGGHITWVVNKEHVFRFDIPAQVASKSAIPDAVFVKIKNLSDGFKSLNQK